MRARLSLVIVSLALAGVPTVAVAGGIEYAGAGAQALGRGGAVAARADDPMVLTYNPAGLAELRGNHVLFDINLALMSACIDPIGFYGWGAYGGGRPSRLTDVATGETLNLNLGDGMPGPAAQYYEEQLDRVCMKQNLLPVPQIGFTFRLSEDLGIGFGMMFPAVTPQGQWGDENGIIRGASGQLRPAPTRYMLMRTGTIGLFPTVGVGYRLTKWLRLGASFEWGIYAIDNTNMAVVSAGTSPSNDIIARVEALDLFVPAATASIHLVPLDSLDIVAAFRYQSALEAPGDITLTTGKYNPANRERSTTNRITAVHFNLPMKLRAGIRYADRLAPRASGSGADDVQRGRAGDLRDPMQDERWDIEVDVEYQLNGRNQVQVIDYDEMQSVDFEDVMGVVRPQVFPDSSRPGGTTDTVVEKRWKNQISVRAGGTYNLLPGLFSLSLGAHYENRGVDPSYMQLDYWPLSRVGLHAGVKFRISKTFDIVASFAHIFQETLVVAAPQHAEGGDISDVYAATGAVNNIDKRVGPAPRGTQPPKKEEVPVANPDGVARLAQNTTKATDGQPPWIINSGTYTSSISVVALGVNVHY